MWYEVNLHFQQFGVQRNNERPAECIPAIEKSDQAVSIRGTGIHINCNVTRLMVRACLPRIYPIFTVGHGVRNANERNVTYAVSVKTFIYPSSTYENVTAATVRVGGN